MVISKDYFPLPSVGEGEGVLSANNILCRRMIFASFHKGKEESKNRLSILLSLHGQLTESPPIPIDSKPGSIYNIK